MAEENTAADIASSPPSFMQAAAEKIEGAKTAAAKAAAREAEAQLTDGMEITLAAVTKATNRLKEQADYLGKIEKVLGQALPHMIAELPLGTILDAQIALETQVDAVEEQLKLVKGHITTAREISLPERLDNEETRTVNAASGARMTRTTRILAGIRAGMKDDAFAWLRRPVFYEDPTPEEATLIEKLRKRIEEGEDVAASEFPVLRPKFPWERNEAGELVVSAAWNEPEPPSYGSLIQETVNSSSLSALAKELLEGGQPLPAEIFNIHTKDGVSITKGKKK